MKTLTMYQRLLPNTTDGHVIKVTTYYSSFCKEEIDALQEALKNTIGSGLVTDCVITKEGEAE